MEHSSILKQKHWITPKTWLYLDRWILSYKNLDLTFWLPGPSTVCRLWPARVQSPASDCDAQATLDMPENRDGLAGKATRQSFTKVKRLLPLRVSLFRYLQTSECNGTTWCLLFITFIDNYTRYIFVYLISCKSEILSCLGHLLNIENQKDKPWNSSNKLHSRAFLWLI